MSVTEAASLPRVGSPCSKERISVELLSDFKREVSRRYDTLIEEKFCRELLAHLETHQRSV